MDLWFVFCFFQAEDGIRDLVRSRGLGDVYKRQAPICPAETSAQDPQNLLAVRSMNVRRSARWLPLVFLLALLRPVGVEAQEKVFRLQGVDQTLVNVCLLYTSDAADDLLCVDLGGRRRLKKKKIKNKKKS